MKRQRGLIDAASDPLAQKDPTETGRVGTGCRITSVAGLLAAVAVGFALGALWRRFMPGA
jgi:hypothetical protein